MSEGKPNVSAPAPAAPAKKPSPKTLAQKVKAATALTTAQEVADRFQRARPVEAAEILETLCTMGHAHKGKQKGTYLP